MKIAMINTFKALKKHNLKAKMTLQVHDEIIIESPVGETKKVIDVVKESMESAAEIKVPLVVDIGTGNNWDQAH